MSRVSRTALAPERGVAARRRHWTVLASVLAGGLLIAPAIGNLPATLPAVAAQEEAAATPPEAGPQVIAQGIARLPKGRIVWTLQRIDVSGTAATPVEAFPLGFILSDDASVIVLSEAEEALGILEDGQAVFLSGGGKGGLAPWRDPAASLVTLALVSEEDAASTTGTVVGAPFDTPAGRAFEIELARDLLTAGEETTIPGSRSGAPTLYLQTDGAAQLISGGGEPVDMSAGDYALLTGDVTVRGAGGPAAFVVAAIGEQAPAKAQDAAGGETRTGGGNRANRANSGAATGGGGGNADARAARQAERAANDAAGATGGTGDADADRAARQAERAARQAARTAAAGAPVPVDGGAVAETPGTPAPVELGTDAVASPSPEATDPVEQQITEDEAESDIIETTAPVEGTPQTGEPIVGEPPVTEPPVEQVPAEDELPLAETPVVEQEIVEEAPIEEVPPETAPVEEAPAAEAPVDQVPAEVAPVEEAPVEEIPVEQVPATDG